MNPIFQFPQYTLKRQVFALTGKLRFYDPQETLVLYVEQKMFRLREDIRVYSDESKSQEVLLIQARSIIDFNAAYDVIDSAYGQRVGTLRRKGWQSMMRDEWEVLDASDQPVGMLFEDSMGQALLRRFLLGTLLPQPERSAALQRLLRQDADRRIRAAAAETLAQAAPADGCAAVRAQAQREVGTDRARFGRALAACGNR